jgi:hypothetical protein
MLKRDVQHHNGEHQRIEPFGGKFADGKILPAGKGFQPFIKAWNAGDRIRQARYNHAKRQNVKQFQSKVSRFCRLFTLLAHFNLPIQENQNCPGHAISGRDRKSKQGRLRFSAIRNCVSCFFPGGHGTGMVFNRHRTTEARFGNLHGTRLTELDL